VHRVQVPLDWIAIVETFVSEKIKLVTANVVGLPNNPLNLPRKPVTKQIENRLNGRSRKEKPGRPQVRTAKHASRNQASRKIKSDAGENRVGTLGQFLTAAVEEFVPVHVRQPGGNL